MLEWLAPGVRTDEQHLVFSITKSVTGLLAGALATRGQLDLGARVGDLVPEVAGSAFASATVRQLMDMEASFAFVEDYTPGPDLAAYRAANGWYPAPPGAPALREFLATRAPDGPHGERFRYLSPAIDLLGWVCARAAGTTWAEAVERHLWQPCGAELGASVTLDREGTPRAAGGMSALPRDVARLGLVLAERGAGIVSEEFLDDLLHGGHRAQWAAGDFAEMWPDGAYRSCWYTPNIDPDVVLGMGIHGQMLYVDVPRQVVVVLLSSWSEPDDEDWHLDNHAVCRTLAHRVAGAGRGRYGVMARDSGMRAASSGSPARACSTREHGRVGDVEPAGAEARVGLPVGVERDRRRLRRGRARRRSTPRRSSSTRPSARTRRGR